MAILSGLIAAHERCNAHRPWPRLVADDPLWRATIARLEEGALVLLGLWGEPDAVHMAVLDESEKAIAVLTLACPDGHYPAVSASHPPALRLDRRQQRIALRRRSTSQLRCY